MSRKNEETVSKPGEGNESGLNSDKEAKRFALNTVADDISARDGAKPDAPRETEPEGDEEKEDDTSERPDATAGKKMDRRRKKDAKVPHKVGSRGGGKVATRGRKRARSPVRRREGSVRRTRCYLSYEEMYTSDVASEGSSVDFPEPPRIAKLENPLRKPHVDHDPKPKITIVEKFTYSKGPVNDSKPSTEPDTTKEHVVKDLSNPNRFRKEEEGEAAPPKSKKQRRRNLSLDTAYYCHTCSKHYYSVYSLSKHEASALHKYNVGLGNYESVSHWLAQQSGRAWDAVDEADPLGQLQSAMGVTDEEMAQLQRLGETLGGPTPHTVAEDLKSHMASALGKLLERALKNVYTPGGKLKTSPLNKPTLDLLQKLSTLYSTKTGQTLTDKDEADQVGEPNAEMEKGLPTRSSRVGRPQVADDIPERNFACPICDVKFERKISINYHIARAHKTADKYLKKQKQSKAIAVKKESLAPLAKDSSDDDSVHTARPASVWLPMPKLEDNESLSSDTASSIQLVSGVIPPREAAPAIFTDEDVDYESPLEMLASQCFEIANRGLGHSEDSRVSTEVSEVRLNPGNKEKAKSNDNVPKIDNKNLEITKTKSKILQCVYLPSRKKAKLLAADDGLERGKGNEAKGPTKTPKDAAGFETNVQSDVDEIDIKEECKFRVLCDPKPQDATTSVEDPVASDNAKRRNKKSRFSEANSDLEEDIRLKAEAALRELNKRSRGNQKLNWGALKFTKSNVQTHKTIGDPGRKTCKVDKVKAGPKVLAGQVNGGREADEELSLANTTEKLAATVDDKSATVDVYEFEDDEVNVPGLDLGFRHQNGVGPKANASAPAKKPTKTKAKHKTLKNDRKDLPASPNSPEKKTPDKKAVPKKQTKPKRQTDYFSQSVEEEWIPPKSATKDNFHEKPSETSAKRNAPEVPLEGDSKVKPDREESWSEGGNTPTGKTSEASSATEPKCLKRKRKSSVCEAPGAGRESPVEPGGAQESPGSPGEAPKTRRGRNHVCYTEIYDDIFSDMEEYDFTNFEDDQEPTRKKVKKVGPKGKNKNDILSCVFGKGRRNSTITIGSDISDMDRECIAQAKSVDNDWDNGEELS